MFSRVVSSLVLLGFVAGQLAAVPHVHCAHAESHGRDSRPHVHLPRLGSGAAERGHAHAHHAHSHGHSHRHTHGGHGGPCRLQGCADTTGTLPDDHDTDAVYLPESLFAAVASKQLQARAASMLAEGPDDFEMLRDLSAERSVAETAFRIRHGQPPDSPRAAENQAIFLTQQRLLL